MTVSSAFVISRRTESFCFSRRRICIGMREWVPPLKSLRSRGTSRPESNRNVDETPGWLPPDVHGLRGVRSEEHTSELQSRLHLVCRLLLEKKKIKIRVTHILDVCRGTS